MIRVGCRWLAGLGPAGGPWQWQWQWALAGVVDFSGRRAARTRWLTYASRARAGHAWRWAAQDSQPASRSAVDSRWLAGHAAPRALAAAGQGASVCVCVRTPRVRPAAPRSLARWLACSGAGCLSAVGRLPSASQTAGGAAPGGAASSGARSQRRARPGSALAWASRERLGAGCPGWLEARGAASALRGTNQPTSTHTRSRRGRAHAGWLDGPHGAQRGSSAAHAPLLPPVRAPGHPPCHVTPGTAPVSPPRFGMPMRSSSPLPAQGATVRPTHTAPPPRRPNAARAPAAEHSASHPSTSQPSVPPPSPHPSY